MEPVNLPIVDTLDLHTFQPRDIPQLLDDYFGACIESGIYSVRVIHGKGKGILRSRVQKILSQHPAVLSFKNAPPEAGGWGSQLVELKRPKAD